MFRWSPALIGLSVALCQASGAVAASPPMAAPPPQSAQVGLTALSVTEMSSISGGTAVVVNTLTQQQLTATSSGNSVTAGTLTSGAVSFSPAALAGFNGVGNFVINTGANNVLQGSINLSIVTAPTL